MANPIFPVLLKTQHDSKLHDIKLENQASRSEMEGGYVVSRPRHTRQPRKTWNGGFTEINEASRLVLEDFWNDVKGGSLIFDWTNPQDGITYQVRFTGEGMLFKYRGYGTTYRWDVTYTVEQA